MDFLNFPELGSEALMEAFKFMLDRLGRALDRRGADGTDDEQAVDRPCVLEGEWQPVAPQPAVIEAKLGRLRELAGALSVYERHPERIEASDPELRAILGELRYLLEIVYGQRITFRGEDRPATGVVVEQRVDNLRDGVVVGIEGEQVAGGHTIQDVAQVEHGSVIGVRANIIGR